MATWDFEDYRGLNKWNGLMPSVTETDAQPRVWDEGFRSFLIKYGMFNHVVYDVFIKKTGNDGESMFGRCRFDDDFEAFSKDGLTFSYVDHLGKRKMEYDFSEEYHVVGNIIASPRLIFISQENWFGFVALSNDGKELVIVYRGTLTTNEWIENATVTMEHFKGQPEETGCDACWNKQEMMVHSGFQQLYEQSMSEGTESPKETVRRLVKENRGTLERITVVGHSLGGAMAQLCGVDLVHHGVAGNIPVTVLAWAAPKIANRKMAKRADSLHPKLRILRIRNPADSVTNLPPDWLWSWNNGGYRHMGVALNVHNKHLLKKKIIKNAAGANHNLQMYLYNIDPSRDVALLNKNGDPLSDEFCLEENISPYWHSQTWPRTVYHD